MVPEPLLSFTNSGQVIELINGNPLSGRSKVVRVLQGIVGDV